MTLATIQERELHVPERELWLTVIQVAFDDAFPPKRKVPVNADGIRHENDRDRRWAEAHRWFNSAGRDFREVCWLAGMQPEVVEALYRKRLNEERAT